MNSHYELAQPDPQVVDNIRGLHERGNIIKIMTARGCVSRIDHTELTKRQLSEWQVPYDELIMNVKPEADFFIDDKAINILDWKKENSDKTGILAGAFDIIHPGYIKMFKQARLHCDRLTVALHVDPNLENGKPQPIHSLEEREEILLALRYVDEVIYYKTETELENLISNNAYDVRFLGEDYKEKCYTGMDLSVKIVWIDRSHEYSTTRLKEKIYESMER
jgi:glycerol-3-phosphate cytidylyltransferase